MGRRAGCRGATAAISGSDDTGREGAVDTRARHDDAAPLVASARGSSQRERRDDALRLPPGSATTARPGKASAAASGSDDTGRNSAAQALARHDDAAPLVASARGSSQRERPDGALRLPPGSATTARPGKASAAASGSDDTGRNSAAQARARGEDAVRLPPLAAAMMHTSPAEGAPDRCDGVLRLPTAGAAGAAMRCLEGVRRLRAACRGSLPARVLGAAVTLVAAYGLKSSYSRAGADELMWVLAPSAFVAELAGVQLVAEPGAGYISRSAHMVVGSACAGVNFLIACWLALYLTAQAELRRTRLPHLLATSFLCFGAAYLVTVSVNGLRIALAAQLFSMDLYGAGWTKARVHRLLGVTLYSAALLGTSLAAQRMQARGAQQLGAARRLSVAVCVYLGISLGIPVLNRAFVRNPGHFAEHALLTTAGAGSVLLLFLLAHRLCSRPTGLAHGQAQGVDRRR